MRAGTMVCSFGWPRERNLEAGRQQLEGIVNEMARVQMPDLKIAPIVRLVPIREIYAGKVRLRILMLLGASALLLPDRLCEPRQSAVRASGDAGQRICHASGAWRGTRPNSEPHGRRGGSGDGHRRSDWGGPCHLRRRRAGCLWPGGRAAIGHHTPQPAVAHLRDRGQLRDRAGVQPLSRLASVAVPHGRGTPGRGKNVSWRRSRQSSPTRPGGCGDSARDRPSRLRRVAAPQLHQRGAGRSRIPDRGRARRRHLAVR